jgi:hypothetical protein
MHLKNILCDICSEVDLQILQQSNIISSQSLKVFYTLLWKFRKLISSKRIMNYDNVLLQYDLLCFKLKLQSYDLNSTDSFSNLLKRLMQFIS